MSERISILFPFRATHPSRHKNLVYTTSYYRTLFPEAEIIVCDDPDPRLFNRGRALNEGVVQSCGDILIFADCDMLVFPDQMHESLRFVNDFGFVVPFQRVAYLSENYTTGVLDGRFDLPWSLQPDDTKFWDRKSTGGVNILTRDAFERIGGFDPEFRGWGFEDAGFSTLSEVLYKPILWLESESPALHMWHPPSMATTDPASKARCKIYTDSYRDREKVEALRNGFSRHCIKSGYRHRLEASQYDDRGKKDTFQKEVYELVAQDMKSLGWHRVADVGCGSGFKLIHNFPEASFRTTGYEIDPTLSWLKAQYPKRKWKESVEWELQDIEADVVICADVIEHLPYPDRFLNYLSEAEVSLFYFSTPDRDICRGVNDLGPPGNGSHYREWNKREFVDFLSRWFKVVTSQITNHKQGTHLVRCHRL